MQVYWEVNIDGWTASCNPPINRRREFVTVREAVEAFIESHSDTCEIPYRLVRADGVPLFQVRGRNLYPWKPYLVVEAEMKPLVTKAGPCPHCATELTVGGSVFCKEHKKKKKGEITK
jgi:hypothetical protein